MAWTDDCYHSSHVIDTDMVNIETNFAMLKNSLYPQQGIKNLGLSASVGAKALTVALKGVDGNDPSATNIVSIAFRSATLTTGTPVIRDVTGATSVVLSSGSTLGFTAALAGRIYVWAIDNAGTVELALSRTADIFPETGLVSTTAEGGAGAADSKTVMYSTTARSNLACRCIGYIEITTGATAGEWDNSPTTIQVMGPGVKRTGDIVQIAYTSSNSTATINTAIPYDNSIPQNSEGSEVLTQAITPVSAINYLYIEAFCLWANSNDNFQAVLALFQDTTADALCAVIGGVGGAQSGVDILNYKMIAGTTSSTTFKTRVGSTGNTVYLNSDATGTRLFGGVAITYLKITEVMA